MLELEQIKSLNELETLVFLYISKVGKKILSMTISEVSEATHVSTTTILRFCKKAGCNGFSEFKIKYRLYLEQPKNKHYSSSVASLLDYFHKIDKQVFDDKLCRTAKILARSKRIIFGGVSSSGVMAKYGSYLFSSYGIDSNYYDDPFYSIPNCDLSDVVVILLSISGETEQIVKRAYSYRERSAYVIAVTNKEDSSLAKCVDEVYCHYIQENKYSFHDLTSQIPAVFILESLATKTKKILMGTDL